MEMEIRPGAMETPWKFARTPWKFHGNPMCAQPATQGQGGQGQGGQGGQGQGGQGQGGQGCFVEFRLRLNDCCLAPKPYKYNGLSARGTSGLSKA